MKGQAMADVQQQAGAVVAAISKGASAATLGGAGGALIYGISADVFGVFVAGGIGVLGIAVKAAIEIYFRQQHLKLSRALHLAGDDPEDEE
jgi:hypothetical protein